MTALCADAGSIETAGAAADDDDFFALVGRHDFCFTTAFRVQCAGNRFAAEHVRYTAEKTADARRHAVEVAVFSLVRHFRISQTLTAKGNEVDTAFTDQEFSILRFRITADGNDRNVDGPFDFFDQRSAETAVNGTGSPHEFVMDVDGTADMEGVDAAFFDKICCNGCCILNRLTAFNVIAGVNTAEDRHLAARLFADVFNDQPRQAHAVFKATAEFVETIVGTGRNEGADQVTVGTVDFDHIDAGTLSAGSRIAIAFDQLIDFFTRNSDRYFAARRGSDGTGGF